MPIFVDFQSSITDELLKESAPLDSEAAVFFGKILARPRDSHRTQSAYAGRKFSGG